MVALPRRDAAASLVPGRAAKLGDLEVADQLQTTLEEEGEIGRALTRLAERKINADALIETS